MHVLIIGAGLAGLTCARLLQQRGIDVSVFEESDGVGGRVRSDYADGYTFDRGFQVLFSAYPAVRRQLDLAALALRAFDPGATICFQDQRAVLTDPLRDRDPRALIDAATTNIVSLADKLRTLRLALKLRSQSIDTLLAGEDTTTLHYLQQHGFSAKMIDTFFRPFYGGIFLDRSLETSAKCFRFDFKMLSEGDVALPSRGIGQLSEQLAKPLVERGAIHLHTKVQQLLIQAERVVGVSLANGEQRFGDAIVVATAAPEATRLTSLPTPTGKRETVTLYFQSDQPFYNGKKLLLNANPNAFVNNAQLITNVAPSYAPAGKHMLSATVLNIPPLTDTELYTLALRDIYTMFRGDIQAQALISQYQPLRLYRIPYAQFSQLPGIHAHLPDNHTHQKGLYLAGEFTEASSLNAAMISGEKCAAALLATLAR